jgi:hypothetical protein
MSFPKVVAVVVLGLGSVDAFACTCIGPGKGLEEQWVAERLNYADVVVLARVTSVSGDYPKSAVLEVKESVKGSAVSTRNVRESHCPGYRPTVGDVRVFFLHSDGRIVACSTFDGSFSTSQLLELLHALRRHSAP